MAFQHTARPLENGRHPKYSHLVMAEIEPHYGSYILTIKGHKGSALISEDDANEIFGKRVDLEFGYIPDDYVDILE